MNPTRPLHGLVLAGGRSSRMGTDKADLVHPDGRPLARRCCDLLAAAACSDLVLSLRYDQSLPAGFLPDSAVRVIRDPQGGSEGPLAGMLAAMRAHPAADWIVLACDLPRLDLPTLTHLIASRLPDERFLAYRSEFDGLPEPLCTYYASTALPLLEEFQSAGIRCPRKVLIRGECRLLDPVTPRALDNANTPEDWQSALTP